MEGHVTRESGEDSLLFLTQFTFKLWKAQFSPRASLFRLGSLARVLALTTYIAFCGLGREVYGRKLD